MKKKEMSEKYLIYFRNRVDRREDICIVLHFLIDLSRKVRKRSLFIGKIIDK